MGTHPIFESDFDCLTESMNPLETDQNSDLDLDCQKLIPSEATITPLDVAPSQGSRSVTPKKRSSSIDRSKETLTFEMGKTNLSELDRNFHYRKLNLESKGLKILGEQLTRFNLISELDVSHNEIMSLGSEMSELKNLIFLNASNNKLTKAFDWGTDTVLTEVNFSNNKIEELVKLLRQKSLRKLDLSMNHVPLFDLNLANNKMETIQGCSNLPNLVELNLR